MGFEIHDSWKTKLDNIGRSDIYQEYDSIVPAEYRTGTYATEYSEWWDYTNFYNNWWSGTEGNVFGIYNGRTYAGYSSRYGINFTTPITIYGTFSIREGNNNYSVGFLIEGRRPDGVYETITNIPATTWSSTVYNLNILDEPKGPYNQIRVTTSGSSWQSIYPHILLTKKTNNNKKALEFPYSGSIKSIILSPGRYKLECWGARGGGYQDGNGASGYGGNGGYATGVLNITTSTLLYIAVGGKGGNATSGLAAGGFNGGGSGYASSSGEPGNGGGGASDIRIGTNSLYARVIVAGGGGGGGEDYGDSYGHGGGLNGGWNGATQTGPGANGSFGQGASTIYGDGGGGGGGWYGGGTGQSYSVGTDTQGGGGGSGYVYTSQTAKDYPSGCLLTAKYYLTETNLISGDSSLPSVYGNTTEIGHADNGYVKITYISERTNSNIYRDTNYPSVFNFDKIPLFDNYIIKK